jgi:hypothetical protein
MRRGTIGFVMLVALGLLLAAPGAAAPAKAPVPPGATTLAANNVTQTSANLNGSVNPNGEATDVYFEYGTTTSYGAMTSVSSAGSGTTGVPVESQISGLTGATVYHFRIVATSAAGTTRGADQTFKTPNVMCVVPKVKGKPLKAAKRAIRAAHCAVGTVKRAYSARVRRGRIVSQRPKPHAVRPTGTKVKLVVSRGRRP